MSLVLLGRQTLPAWLPSPDTNGACRDTGTEVGGVSASAADVNSTGFCTEPPVSYHSSVRFRPSSSDSGSDGWKTRVTCRAEV